MNFETLRGMSNEELLKKTQEKAAQERMLTAEVLKMLQEVDRRKLYAARGFSSLFEFCVEFLGYAEASAQRRVESVRLLNVLPEVGEKIREGRLTLSNVAQAQAFFRAEAKAGHTVTLEEKKEVLKQLEGKSTRAAERELMALSSDPEAIVQKEKIRIVSETHSEVKFYAPQELLEQLEQIRGLLAHKNPNLSTVELIAEIAQIALEKLQPKKPKAVASEAAPEKDQKKDQRGSAAGAENALMPASKTEQNFPASETPKRTRYIPAAIKSEVYHRDGGSCSYRDPLTGRRCGSQYKLQYDHWKIPFAKGGESTVENLAIRCIQHNSLNAITHYGLAKMESHWKPSRKD